MKSAIVDDYRKPDPGEKIKRINRKNADGFYSLLKY